jgi:PAS domain S-box-containing protein
MIGQPITCLISPEQIGEESEILSRLRRGERIEDYETSRMAKDGRMLNVSLTISPVKNASGAIIGASKIIRDITERKRAEKALKEREIRLSFIQEGGSIGTWDWDIAANRLHWSEVQCALFGVDPAKRDSVSFEDWLATVHPDDRAGQIELLEDALSSGGNDPDPDSAYRIIRPDGVRWINARGRVQRDANGKGIRMFGVTLDITERKRTEQRLAESVARFRAAQEASLDAFLIYEPIQNETGLIVDLKIVYANSKAAEMCHLQPQEMEGNLIGGLFPRTKSSDGFIAQLGRIYQSGRPEEFVLDYDGDGLKSYVQNSVAPFGSYIATTFRNITAQVEGTIALTAAKAEAERANVTKSKFLAAASHDLRQPVQSLTLLMEVIKRQAKDRPKVVELADMAQASVSSLNGMLTGILDISKLDAGVIAPVMASTDIGELVERMAREYRPRAAVNGLELRYLPRPLRASTDASLLERIVRNLIENALRYTAKGGVLVGVRQRGEFVRLDVIDTGIGIPADQQAEIFDEFRQLNNPARDSSRGLGLGLAIVSRLARLLGIRVEVASKVGRGTRFSLLLPLDRTGTVTPEITAPAVDSGGRILIIEDNADVRHAYELMLSDWGYETISAVNGEDALERAAHEDCRFDAILADHRLGAGLTGTAASSEIARRANRTFPTLVVTGDTAKERIVEIKSSGFGMLHKPVEAEDLHRALAELFRQNVRLLSETVPDSPPCAKNPPANC